MEPLIRMFGPRFHRKPTRKELKAELELMKVRANTIKAYYDDIPEGEDADDWEKWRDFADEAHDILDNLSKILFESVVEHPELDHRYMVVKQLAKDANKAYTEINKEYKALQKKARDKERQIKRYKNPSREAAIEVSCPYCDAKKGEYCATAHGNQANKPHADRSAKYARRHEDDVVEARQACGELRDALHPLERQKKRLYDAMQCLKDVHIPDNAFGESDYKRIVVMASRYRDQNFTLVRTDHIGSGVWKGATEFPREALQRLVDAGLRVDILDGQALHLMTKDN